MLFPTPTVFADFKGLSMDFAKLEDNGMRHSSFLISNKYIVSIADHSLFLKRFNYLIRPYFLGNNQFSDLKKYQFGLYVF